MIGRQASVEAALQGRASGATPLRTNATLMGLLERVKPGSTFWMVGDQSLLQNLPGTVPSPTGNGASIELPALKSLIVTGDLEPVVSLAITGDAAELTCIGEALERLAALLGPGVLICADSALGHFKNLCAAHRAGLRFVVPLRASTGFAHTFLAEVGARALRPLRYVTQRDKGLPRKRRLRFRGTVRPLAVTDPETGEDSPFRVVYVWSSEEASSVAEARERALNKAETELAKLRRGLGGRYYKTLQRVDARIATILIQPIRGLLVLKTALRAGKPTVEWHRDRTAISAAARMDGIYALATNLPGRLSASRILRLYKEQFRVELRHRDAKQTLRVRPLFLHNDDRIAALVSVVGLALLVFGIIEAAVRRGLGPGQTLPILPEGRAALPTGRSILAVFQGLGLTYAKKGPLLDHLTATQRRILRLLDARVPWPEGDSLPSANCGKRA